MNGMKGGKRLLDVRAGISGDFEMGIRFSRWADHRHTMPTVADVMLHWDVSKATAFRWLARYKSSGGYRPQSLQFRLALQALDKLAEFA